MHRILLGFALAAAILIAPAALSVAPAEAGAKASTKVCKHKTSSGKVKTWRCGSDQPCCSSEMLNYYTCGSKTLGCL